MNLKTSDDYNKQSKSSSGGRQKKGQEEDDSDIFNHFKNMFR